MQPPTLIPALLLLLALVAPVFAKTDPETKKAAAQQIQSLPVKVVDADGQPVQGAKVIPWALRSSQGHGHWRAGGATAAGPATFVTDEEGHATVSYPLFAKPAEEVLTLQVTLLIDHPKFAVIRYEDVDVPRDAQEPHQAKLSKGTALELTPTSGDEPIPLREVYAMWSDGRSWSSEDPVDRASATAIRIPPMPSGKGYVRLVRLEGDRVKAFSRLLEFELREGETIREIVELQSPIAVRGKLSENVPRPVKNGRIKAETLNQSYLDGEMEWFAWAPIAEDGSFEIETWPRGESMQAIALCDGYVGAQGARPQGLNDQRLGTGFYRRPQVFQLAEESAASSIVVDMEPMAPCEIKTVDRQKQPVAGVNVWANPNVQWWNGGSQVYGAPLVRMERVLLTRDYQAAIEEAYLTPFSATTDEQGVARMELPAGTGELRSKHDAFELPISLGRRTLEVVVKIGHANQINMPQQPMGTELLGEWDKLAGVLFGCRGEECRRLINDPAFRAKMDSVRADFDAAADPTAPSLLHGAYKKMAEAFDDLDDQEEAAKWRHKAEEQAAKRQKK